MASIGDLIMRVVADLKGFQTQVVNEATKAGDKAGAAMSKSTKKSFGGNLKGGILQGLGIGAGLGVLNATSMAISGVTDAIFESIDAASDQREAMALSEQVFQDNSSAMEEWAETASDSFGESKTAALNYAAGFGNVLQSTGEDMDAIGEKSRQLTERAADLGSAFNASGEDVATALKAGLVGETEPLRRFGILLNANSVAAEAYAMGIANAGDELTEGQKVLARYSLIMKQSSKSAGMFGRDQDSLADAQKSLTATVEDLSAEVGTELVPVFADLANTAKNDLIPTLRDLAGVWSMLTDDSTGLGLSLEDLPFVGTGAGALRMANDMREAQRAGRELYDRLEGNRGAMARTSAATEEAGDDLDTYREKVRLAKVGVQKMTDALRENAATLEGEAMTAITSYYDTIDERRRLNEINEEQAQIRRDARGRQYTDEEKQRLYELGQEYDELFAGISSRGEASLESVQTEIDKWIARSRKATGQAKRDADAIVAHYMRIKFALMQVKGQMEAVGGGIGGGIGRGTGGRASGGPVSAGTPYYVGETGRELFVPAVDGMIVPNHAIASGEVAAMGGPAVGTLEIYGLPLQAETPREVVREMQRATRLMTAPHFQQPQGWK